jgi:hypothetical protein
LGSFYVFVSLLAEDQLPSPACMRARETALAGCGGAGVRTLTLVARKSPDSRLLVFKAYWPKKQGKVRSIWTGMSRSPMAMERRSWGSDFAKRSSSRHCLLTFTRGNEIRASNPASAYPALGCDHAPGAFECIQDPTACVGYAWSQLFLSKTGSIPALGGQAFSARCSI